MSGPKVTLTVYCTGCDYHASEYYCIEDGNDIDSGFNHYCKHWAVCGDPPRARVETGLIPPPSCPFVEPAIAAAFAANFAKRNG
jgi:hypothetical protein